MLNDVSWIFGFFFSSIETKLMNQSVDCFLRETENKPPVIESINWLIHFSFSCSLIPIIHFKWFSFFFFLYLLFKFLLYKANWNENFPSKQINFAAAETFLFFPFSQYFYSFVFFAPKYATTAKQRSSRRRRKRGRRNEKDVGLKSVWIITRARAWDVSSRPTSALISIFTFEFDSFR